MKRQWESMFKLVSLLPTPQGWKVVDTWIDEGTYRREEIPIVGFATVRRFSRREGDIAWCQDGDDQVEPLLFHSDLKAALPISDYMNCCDDRVTTVVPPGSVFDENLAADELKTKTEKRIAV